MRYPTHDERLFAERLQQMVGEAAEYRRMTNAELAARLVDDVWAHLPVTSPVSLLLSEIAERLMGETQE